ncbi:MAG: protein kinase [Planctomycetes bacterium]|nr:protein kinase [Planctomycetota bacterium]
MAAPTLHHAPLEPNAADTEPAARRVPGGPPDLPGYRILEELGRGGMGVVYRALDERSRSEVAIKTLLRMSPNGLQMFKQEFRALADIAHPNIAALHELVSDGSTWCFTMELLQGVDFLDYVMHGFEKTDEQASEPAKPPGESGVDSSGVDPHYELTEPQQQRLADAMTQMITGLHTLHQNGKLHRDIKPSNVMVTTEGRLVLLDFGLVGDMREKVTDGTILGTPSYMPPEQAAGRPTSPASDWYSVGVMLYEVLAGQLPYKGRPYKILADKQSIDPPPPHQVAPAAPRELSELCVRLLDRDPEKRPPAAEIMELSGGSDLAETLRATSLNPAQTDVELVGREPQLKQLEQAWREVETGETRNVFVSGRSGMGKSVLISKFLEQLAERCHDAGDNAVILEGRCYEQESVPFKALDSLIDALAVFLGQMGRSEVRKFMPEDSPALTRLFPVLGQFQPGSAKRAELSLLNADPQEIRQRAVTALRELLSRIGEQRPLVLYIDDLQWGDADSATLLAELLRPPDSPKLLLLGSFRAENVGINEPLKRLDEEFAKGEPPPHRQDLTVESLSEDESRRLATMLLGEDLDAGRKQHLAERIAQESGGWPFFVWELAQHVREDVALSSESLELDEVIWSRVNRLPESTRRLLEVLSVAGRPTRAVQAYRAIALVSQGPGLLAQLRTGSFVRLTDDEDRRTIAETYHGRIRESVIAHLSGEDFQQHSLQIAEVVEAGSGIEVSQFEAQLESTTGSVSRDAGTTEETGVSLNPEQWDCVFDLAAYFTAAGCPERALPYALAAAEQAQRQEALEVAEQQFRIAEQAASEAPSNIRFRIAEGLGSVLMMRGKYDGAEQRLTLARDLADGDLIRAKTEARLGELAFKRGDMTNAAETLEAALRNFDERIPRNLFGYVIALSKEFCVQTLHSLLPSVFVHRRKTEPPDTERVRIKLMSRLSYVNWFARGGVPTLWSHLREVNLAERYLPSLELAQAWSEHAPAMTMLPLHARGIRYAEKSLEIRKEKKHLWGQGQSLHFLGISLHAASRIRDSVEVLEQAVDIFERTGDPWEANLVRYQLGLAYYRLGDLKRGVDISIQVHRSGMELGDEQAMGISLHGWALASHGQVPVEILQKEMARDRFDAQCTVQVLLGEAIRLYYAGYLPEASRRLDEALAIIRKNTLRSTFVAPVYSWRATVLRRRLESESLCGTLNPKLLRRTKRAIWGARLLSKSYRIESPHALREAGELALLQGKRQKALRRFEQSLAEAEKYELVYQAAATRVRLLELQCENGAAGDDDVQAAKATLAAMIPAPDSQFADSAAGS